MSGKVRFRGKVVRLEKEGFGIVEFDQALGANTHGVFSNTISEPGIPFRELTPGVLVEGTADVDDRDLAAVKTLRVETAR